MPKAIVRDDVVPATVFNPHTNSYVAVCPGAVFDADDPFVAEIRWALERGVEQATAAPGEKRASRVKSDD